MIMFRKSSLRLEFLFWFASAGYHTASDNPQIKRRLLETILPIDEADPRVLRCLAYMR